MNILRIGTERMTDEEAINRIILVNRISLGFAASLLTTGPIICGIFGWPRSMIIPLIIEFFINGSVIFLNYYEKHVAAGLTLYLLQCLSITYFGLLIGPGIQLEFTIFFMILINYLIFKEDIYRRFCLFAALAVLVILEASYFIKDKSSLPHVVVVTSVFGIILLVHKPYVQSNDIRYELKRANFFIKIFVAQLSHELRTSLDSMHHVTQILKKEVRKDERLQGIESLVDMAFSASTDACNTISNVLGLSEIEAGKLPPVVNEAFQMEPYFRKIVDMQELNAQEEYKQIRLVINRMPAVVISDPVHIRHILTNLLSNAIKFAFKGTTIDVVVKKHSIQAFTLSVANIGPVIPPEKQACIFDLFVTSKTGHNRGTGLGLHIVKNKVAAMDGSVEVESNLGGYTVFSVTLPLVEGELKNVWNNEGSNKDSPNLANVHILVAEDRKIASRLLFRTLDEMGVGKVSMVYDGLELLQVLKKNSSHDLPDMILLDCHMPNMAGEELVRKLKKSPELAHIPLIIMTADTVSDVADKMLAAGADVYLKKPLDHELLLRTVTMYLNNKVK
jgi:signal transduction histidine kinase/CheY-like chemotaxis protein